MKLKKLQVVTECGMLLAMALALSNLKLYQMPNGGSVSLGALPVFILAARHGLQTGVLCGTLMGLLLLTTRPFIVHPLQFILDYPMAYASLGVAGAVMWSSPLKAATATTVANIIRLHFHVVAGAVFFVAAESSVWKSLAASYAYNLIHMVPETLLCAAISWFIARNHRALCARQQT